MMLSKHRCTLSTAYTVVLFAATIAFSPFIASPSFAGAGTFTGPTWTGDTLATRGKLDIYVLLDADNTTPAADLEAYFTRISEELYDATEKQVQLGTVIVYRGGPEGKDNADLLVTDAIRRGYTYPGGFEASGSRGRIYLNPGYLSDASRSVVVHEMGHAVFNILDSYLGYLQDPNDASRYLALRGDDTGYEWVDTPYYWDASTVPSPDTRNTFFDTTDWDTDSLACLMDGPWAATGPGGIKETEFSTPAGTTWQTAHKLPYEKDFVWATTPIMTLATPFQATATVVTQQNAGRNNASAWETLVAYRPSMRLPQSEPTADTDGHEPINFQVAPSINALSISIDRSGSMYGQPLSLAKIASSLVIALTHEGYVIVEPGGNKNIPIAGDFLSVTSFNDVSTVVFADAGQVAEMTPANKAAAVASLLPITATGTTSIGAGLQESLNTFASASNAVPRSIILLSDGQENSPPYVSMVLPDLIAHKIKVFAVGLGDGADVALLSRVASETGGKFYFANSAVQLPGIFASVYAQLRSDGVLAIIGGVLNLVTGADVGTYTVLSPWTEEPTAASSVAESVYVDGAVGEATFLVTWDKGSGAVSLVTPGGVTITKDDIAMYSNVQYHEGAGYAFYRVKNVANGEWGVLFTGEEENVQWGLKVFGVDNEIVLDAKSDKSAYVYPEPVIMRASAAAPQPVIGGHATAVVRAPDGSSSVVKMFDDGDVQNSGDVNKNDGVYAGKLEELPKNGVYTVTVEFDSQGGVTPTPRSTTGIQFAIPEEGQALLTPEPVEAFVRYEQFALSVDGVPAFIPATVQVDPETLNLESKGRFITGYVELPEPYDVYNIVRGTVVLEQKALGLTLRTNGMSEIADFDADENRDLMVKFDRSALIAFLRAQNVSWQSVEFTVSGELESGQPFSGQSTVRVIH